MTSTAHTHQPPTGRVPLSFPIVVTVLYVGMFTPAEWRQLGPARIAVYVTEVAADPRARIPELAALLITADLHGLTGVAAEQLAAAVKFAPAVLAAANQAGR